MFLRLGLLFVKMDLLVTPFYRLHMSTHRHGARKVMFPF